MRTDWTITITDYRGARHFTLSAKLRRKLVLGSTFAITLCAVGLLYLVHQSQRLDVLGISIDELNTQRLTLIQQNQYLQAEQQDLLATIQHRNQRLVSLDNGVQRLQSLLGADDESMATSALEHRLTATTDLAFEKLLILRSIPRGAPVIYTGVNSNYGNRIHPVKQVQEFHSGLDLNADMRTEVKATSDGIVARAGFDSNGIGKVVEIRHNYGFSTVYGHLDNIDVEEGDVIRQGDILGLSGKTGRITGPHLHYEVRYMDKRLNPKPFLNWDLEQYETLFTQQKAIPWDSLEKVIAKNARQQLPPPVAQRLSPPKVTLTAASP